MLKEGKRLLLQRATTRSSGCTTTQEAGNGTNSVGEGLGRGVEEEEEEEGTGVRLLRLLLHLMESWRTEIMNI